MELQLPAEELYQAFCCSTESVNVIVAMDNDEALGDAKVDPTKDTVAFGSGLHQWAFTLKVSEDKMMSKFWRDWYFDATRKYGPPVEREDHLSVLSVNSLPLLSLPCLKPS